MNQKNINPKLLSDLDRVVAELKKDQVYLDDYKKQVLSDIKLSNKSLIKNTEFTEKKYNLWQRILRTLGIT